MKHSRAQEWRDMEAEARQNGFTERTDFPPHKSLKEDGDFIKIGCWAGRGQYVRAAFFYLLTPEAVERVARLKQAESDKKRFNRYGGRKLATGWRYHGITYTTLAEAMVEIEATATRAAESEKRRRDMVLHAALNGAADDVNVWKDAGFPQPVPLDSGVYVAKKASGMNWRDFQKAVAGE